MVIFLYNPYIFVWLHHISLANMVFALDPSNSVIKRLSGSIKIIFGRWAQDSSTMCIASKEAYSSVYFFNQSGCHFWSISLIT